MVRTFLLIPLLFACAACAGWTEIENGRPMGKDDLAGFVLRESFDSASPFRLLQANCEVKTTHDGLVNEGAGRCYRLDATLGKSKKKPGRQMLYHLPIASVPVDGEVRFTARIKVEALPENAKVHVGTLMYLPKPKALLASGGYTIDRAGAQWHDVVIEVPKQLQSFAAQRNLDPSEARLTSFLLIVEGDFNNDRVALRVDDVVLYTSAQKTRDYAARGQIARAPDSPGVAYAMKPFETLVPPIALPPEKSSQALTIYATPGEFEPATFAFFAARTFPEVALRTTALRSAAGDLIRSEAIDARVVKIWRQQGPYNQYQGLAADIPELLVKDDRMRLEGIQGVRPDVRLTGDVETSFRAGQTKQFWITVRVPKDAKAGTYHGTVSLEAGKRVLVTLPLTVTVLPFTLDDHGKDIGIYLQSKLHTKKSEEKMVRDQVSERLFRLQLKDLKEHGITAPTCYTSHKGDLDAFIRIMSDYGFRGPIGYMGGYDDAKDLAKINKKFKAADLGGLAVYLQDEPHTDEQIAAALKVAAVAREAGVLTWAAMLNERAVREIGSKLDINNWMISSEFLPPDEFRGMKARREAQKRIHKKYWYYWQSMTEHPLTNRTFVGLYLYLSGFDGVCPYVYQTTPANLYDNRDRWDAVAGNVYRMHHTTYTSKNGPITTIQWEGWREGVDDLRYIITLKNLVDKAGPDAKGPAVRRGRKLLEEIQNIPKERVTAAGLFALRRQLAEAITAIRK